MKIRFVTQPYADGTDLRDFLQAVAADPKLDLLRIIVAWAKRSGLSRAAADLKSIRDRGGQVLAVVGVSEGGATEQGLKALLDQADDARIFHDRDRTFHPKVYLAESDAHALLLVGSHNLTAGGMAWNYEAGIWVTLDRSQSDDEQVRNDVVSYFERLRNDTAVCLPLDSPNLARILADSTLVIQNEDARSSAKSPEPDAPEDSDSAETSGDGANTPTALVFGKSKEKKRRAPTITKPPKKAPPRKTAPVTGGLPGAPSALTVVKRWFKVMDGTAAQHPPGPNSKRTGNLRLSQGPFAIDHKIYFREVFFAGLDWRPQAKRQSTEELWVSMQTVITGDYLGDVNIRISHNPGRISSQGNVPTVLHWGDLAARLRANSCIGLTVTLERGEDDRFALTIADAPTGPFAY
ncbi:MAG TPA: phospholipase D family protein [Jatrophihabitans sp.]|nr:phospholipase D family protein [Jatrophihabitans sp.]